RNLARFGQVVLDQVTDDGDPPLLGGGDGRQHVHLGNQPVRHQTLGQALQGLAERRGGAGEVVHGRGIASSVVGHFNGFVILTGGRGQLLNRRELSASGGPWNRTLVTARERRLGPGPFRSRKKEPPHEAGAPGFADPDRTVRSQALLAARAARRRKVLVCDRRRGFRG